MHFDQMIRAPLPSAQDKPPDYSLPILKLHTNNRWYILIYLLYAQYTAFVKWNFRFFVFFETKYTKKRHRLVMPLK